MARPTLALLIALTLWSCLEGDGPVAGPAFLPDTSQTEATDGGRRDQAIDAPQGDAGEPPAADTYLRLCASCHGPLGEGGVGPNLTLLGARDRATLAERIARTMPPQDPGLCTGPCADALADLILDVLAAPPETCDPGGALPRRLRLLTRREYANSLKDLFFFDSVACEPPLFRLAPDPQPTRVHVAGSFNGWPATQAAGGWAMAARNGVWTVQRPLPPGRHSYKFVLDERTWIPDPTNPLREPDGFGGENSVVEVPPCDAPPEPSDFTEGIPSETRPEGFVFETHAPSGRVTTVHLEAYLNNAERAARAALSRGGAWLPCEPASAGCPERFATEVGRRVFRRPLTEAERAEVAEQARTRGFEVALVGLLASPHFLYRSERGDPVGDGRFALSGPERATALAYFLWGSTPDDALQTAGEAGRLQTSAGLLSEARRLLADHRARETLGAFAEQWLGIEGVPTMTKASNLQPFFGDDVRAALVEETRGFVQDAFFAPDGFAALYSAPHAVVDPRLAPLYGAETHGRVGILGQAAVLATYAHSDQSSPIRRGLFVRNRLLCQAFQPPPPNAGGVPDVDPNANTRTRFRQHTANPFCASCHRYIDDVGFGFEAFDALGRYRTEEAGLPIDASGNMNDVNGLGTDTAAPYADLAGLGRTLALSDAAPQCLATQVRRFALGTLEGPLDRCALGALQQDFLDGDRDLQALLLAVVASPEFVLRMDEAATP